MDAVNHHGRRLIEDPELAAEFVTELGSDLRTTV